MLPDSSVMVATSGPTTNISITALISIKTTITPRTRQRYPFVNSALRRKLAIMPGLSTTAAGTATHRTVNARIPGTTSSIRPARVIRPARRLTAITGNSRPRPLTTDSIAVA